jgi:hypothetical protein
VEDTVAPGVDQLFAQGAPSTQLEAQAKLDTPKVTAPSIPAFSVPRARLARLLVRDAP